jgi:adenine-specific DNA methylase
MDSAIAEVQKEDLRLECLLMSFVKVQKHIRKMCRSRGRNAEFHVIYGTPIAEHAAEFRTGEELTANQLKDFRKLVYDDFLELMQPMDSPHVS